MKKIMMWCVIGVLSLVSVAWSQAQMTGGTEKAVAALEQQWLQAMKSNNPDLLAPLLADRFVNTSTDGKVTGKTETVAEVNSMKWNTANNSDVKVTVFGDTAIATGDFKSKGTDASGRAFDVDIRWTDTWMKMPSGQWQCVASQGTAVKA
jgi:ketosteroid isomerase-like protein